jgi:hypothetical protein
VRAFRNASTACWIWVSVAIGLVSLCWVVACAPPYTRESRFTNIARQISELAPDTPDFHFPPTTPCAHYSCPVRPFLVSPGSQPFQRGSEGWIEERLALIYEMTAEANRLIAIAEASNAEAKALLARSRFSLVRDLSS